MRMDLRFPKIWKKFCSNNNNNNNNNDDEDDEDNDDNNNNNRIFIQNNPSVQSTVIKGILLTKNEKLIDKNY